MPLQLLKTFYDQKLALLEEIMEVDYRFEKCIKAEEYHVEKKKQ